MSHLNGEESAVVSGVASASGAAASGALAFQGQESVAPGAMSVGKDDASPTSNGVPSSVTPQGDSSLAPFAPAPPDDQGRGAEAANPAGSTVDGGTSGDWRADAVEGGLLSHGAGLLANCAPFSRTMITRAFDRILEQLGDADSTLPAIVQQTFTIPGVTGVVVALSIAVAARRRLRNREDEPTSDTENEDLSVFPTLPSRRQRLALEEL